MRQNYSPHDLWSFAHRRFFALAKENRPPLPEDVLAILDIRALSDQAVVERPHLFNALNVKAEKRTQASKERLELLVTATDYWGHKVRDVSMHRPPLTPFTWIVRVDFHLSAIVAEVGLEAGPRTI